MHELDDSMHTLDGGIHTRMTGKQRVAQSFELPEPFIQSQGKECEETVRGVLVG